MKTKNIPILLLLTLGVLGFVLVLILNTGHMPATSNQKLASLKIEQVTNVDIKPVIDPYFFENANDQALNKSVVEALNKSTAIYGNSPDYFSITINIALTSGRNIMIEDCGDNIFQVTLDNDEGTDVFLISSDQLKNILAPYQERFKREISLKKNISLYSIPRQAGIVIEDVIVREEPVADSHQLYSLKKGELIRTLAKRTVSGNEWYFVDNPCQDLPNLVGWIEGKSFTTGPSPVLPRSGFTKGEVILYSNPSQDSQVLMIEPESTPLYIDKRVNEWAYCFFPGGVDGWIKNIDLSLSFPTNFTNY